MVHPHLKTSVRERDQHLASSDGTAPGVSTLGIHCSDQVLAGIRHNNMGSVLEVELVEAGGGPTGVGATSSSTFY